MMVKKICETCQQEIVQLKHSSICACGRKLLTVKK